MVPSIDLVCGLVGGILATLIVVQAVQKYRDPSTGEGWFSAFERSAGKALASLTGVLSGALAAGWDALVDPNVSAALKSALGGIDPKWAVLVPVVIAFAAYRHGRKAE